MTARGDKPITWDQVYWENTHLQADVGMYHLGIIDDDTRGRFVALSVSHDDKEDSPEPQIILLQDSAIDDLLSALRQAAKSL